MVIKSVCLKLHYLVKQLQSDFVRVPFAFSISIQELRDLPMVNFRNDKLKFDPQVMQITKGKFGKRKNLHNIPIFGPI